MQGGKAALGEKNFSPRGGGSSINWGGGHDTKFRRSAKGTKKKQLSGPQREGQCLIELGRREEHGHPMFATTFENLVPMSRGDERRGESLAALGYLLR